MMGLSALLLREPTTGHGAHLTHVDDDDDKRGPPRSDPLSRHVRTTDGASYRYRAVGLPGQGILSAGGAVMAGLISTGVGEATLPGLVRRSGFPLPVAAATSTVVVAATVAGAAVAHLVELSREGGSRPSLGTSSSGPSPARSWARSSARSPRAASRSASRVSSSQACSESSGWCSSPCSALGWVPSHSRDRTPP